MNVPRGSRKDARDAVLAAKGAADGWAARTAYNRGQILYRLAEVMESRQDELRVSLERGGLPAAEAAAEVSASVDRAVYYAGFCDKFQALVASHNPVAGPHFGFGHRLHRASWPSSRRSGPRCSASCPPSSPSSRGPTPASSSPAAPIPAPPSSGASASRRAISRRASSTCSRGQSGEMAYLAKHREVVAMDVWSADADLRTAAEREGSGNVKRVRTHDETAISSIAGERGQGLGFIERFLETKTVWHPVGVGLNERGDLSSRR